MNNRYLGATAMAVVLCSACVPQGGEQTLGSAITAAKVPLTNSLSLSEKLAFEQRLSKDSLAFLSDRSAPTGKSECSTSAEREVGIAKKRLLTFKAVEEHFNTIQSELNNNFDANKIVDRVDQLKVAWDQIPFAPHEFTQHLALIQGVLKAAAKTANDLQKRDDYARKIPQLASDFAPKLKLVSADLKSSLATSKANLTAYLITWKTCEYERLKVIYARENADPVAVAALFENFKTKSENFEKDNNVVIGNEKVFQKIEDANTLLSNPKFDYENAIAILNEVKIIFSDFQSVNDEFKKL